MARPAKFTDEQVLDAALAVVGRAGRAATMAEIAAEVGCQVGSLYYRFPSREVLLIRLWIRSVRRFQAEFLAAAARPDPADAVAAAARTIPEYCAAHPDEARALTLFRHQALMEAGPPPEVAEDLTGLNDHAGQVLGELVARRFGRVAPDLIALVDTVIREVPYGLVRRHIGAAEPMPPWLPDLIGASVSTMLAVGDTWTDDEA